MLQTGDLLREKRIGPKKEFCDTHELVLIIFEIDLTLICYRLLQYEF